MRAVTATHPRNFKCVTARRRITPEDGLCVCAVHMGGLAALQQDDALLLARQLGFHPLHHPIADGGVQRVARDPAQENVNELRDVSCTFAAEHSVAAPWDREWLAGANSVLTLAF